mgnify:CR=1 FL=1
MGREGDIETGTRPDPSCGESDSFRGGVGESAKRDDPRLEVMGETLGRGSKGLGLSLPVGPFPSGGRLAGGKLRA